MTALLKCPMANIIPMTLPAPPTSWRGVQPTDMDSALRMSKAIAQSGLAPRAYYENNNDPVACCFVAMQLGGEIGLSPMASIQNIAVINGRPGLYGPAQLAVVEASGKLATIEETIDGEGDAREAVCTVQRVGRKPRTVRFSVADAKRAGLWDKRGRNNQPGPWQQYPERMLQARARSFALRDVFPDVLLGLAYSAEELQDIPPEPGPEHARDVTPPQDEETSKPTPQTPTPQTAVALPGGEVRFVDRTWDGAHDALDVIHAHSPGAVALNADLLNRIAQRVPELAERVTAIRRAAEQQLRGDDPDDLTDEALGVPEPQVSVSDVDPETGDIHDDTARKMALRRGAAPDPDEVPPTT